jgi:hypothetical protein
MQAGRQSRACQGWKASVATQRYHIRRLLKRAPSLKNQVAEEIAEGYKVAVGEAAAGTELPEWSFPQTCPFTVEQILDEEFFPE